jgi:hypothetical protein
MTMRSFCIALLLLFLAACADPYGIYHKVRDKEDLQKISLLYQVDIDKLRAANNMGRADEVKAGDYLFVPGVKAPSDGTVKSVPSQKKDTGTAVGTGKQALATTRSSSGRSKGWSLRPSASATAPCTKGSTSAYRKVPRWSRRATAR